MVNKLLKLPYSLFKTTKKPPNTNAFLETETPHSNYFTTSPSSESRSFSTEPDHQEDFYHCDDECLEVLVRGIVTSSERLFFEPKARGFGFGESGAVVVIMETEDPYGDFRGSMEEMVECGGVRDWEGLEELLSWYLRMNVEGNHGFIVGAFVNLIFDLPASPASVVSSSSASTSTTAYSSAVSSFVSASFCCLSEVQNHEIDRQ